MKEDVKPAASTVASLVMETSITVVVEAIKATEAGKDTAEVTTITRAVKAKGVVTITAAVTIGK